MTQPTVLNLHLNECSQELLYYLFVVNLDRCAGNGNTLDDLSSKVYVPNETKELNFHVFKMITGIKELKKLTKHISCKCECKFDSKKRNSNQKWNNDKCRGESANPKEHCVCQKVIFGIQQHVIAKLVNM